MCLLGRTCVLLWLRNRSGKLVSGEVFNGTRLVSNGWQGCRSVHWLKLIELWWWECHRWLLELNSRRKGMA
jgi:hypothetical protein